MPADLAHRRQEFRRFVWNHAADEFQAKFDQRAALTDEEILFLKDLFTYKNLNCHQSLAEAIRKRVAMTPRSLLVLLQLLGLTRNKILQDIKGFARESDLSISTSKPHTLFNSAIGTKLASEYLAHQAIRVFAPTNGNVPTELLQAVNQATWPGYIRQERAKRQGHEAENRIAKALLDCGIPFEPTEKATNPLCRDILIDGVSYDLVVPNAADARVRFKATVHTSNIGQYGESKDDLEIQQAIAAIRRGQNADDVVLLALIDGVGFESNRAGLDGVLTNATEFCQFRTLWKAVVICATKTRRKSTVALPAEQHEHFAEFARNYGATVVDINTIEETNPLWIRAGDGRIRVTSL